MKKTLLVVMALLTGALASNAALAWGHHHGGVRFGVFVGAPLFPAYYPYYYPAYYPPAYYPPVVVQQQPPVYVGPSDVPATQAPAAQGMWYYCEATRGYYPYVKSCPGGWQAVPPAPPQAGG